MSKSRFVPASPNYTVARKDNPLEDTLPRMKWLDRVKTDYALSKAPYFAKTNSQALQSVFSLLWPVADFIRPRYIQEGDLLYAKPVENLVLAVRGLASKNYKNAHQSLHRIPLYASIVQTLRDWDVEAVNRELTILQREPRNRSFADFGPLAVALLRPLFRLSRLNPHVHLLPAVSKMYEFARMYLTNQDERQLLQRYYDVARDELPVVFTQLRQRLYPVLLKLLSDTYLELDPFFLEKEAAILAFLDLKEEDLVTERAETEERPPERPITGASTPIPDAPRVPRLAQQGLDSLDTLFPRSGWNALEKQPDFYSYFQTIFEYPKGSDLVPVDDPIQIIQPLSEVIQQLFYGFQNVQWGTAVNQGGDLIRLQEELDKGIARWHFFHEEFFGKNYLPLLQEYCREVERSGTSALDSRRREHQLLWFKRNYLLPHLNLPVMDDVRVKSLGYPNLAVQVREMIDLLAPIAVEIEQKGSKAMSMLNPDGRVKFPVTNMVSLRFQAAQRRTDKADNRILDQGNNRALLFSTLSMLTALDYLLSKPDSPLYAKQQRHLYRTSGLSGDDKPVYNAPKKNSLALLKKLNDQPPPSLEERPWPSRGENLLGALMTNEEVKAAIQEHHVEKKPFALISMRTWSEAPPELPGVLDSLLAGNTLHAQDDGTWGLVLRDTLEEDAEEWARKALGLASRRDPPLAMGALVVPFYTNWNLDKLFSLLPRGWEKAREVSPQILGVWVNSSQTFEFRSDVPAVALGKPEAVPAEAAEGLPTIGDLPEA